MRFGSKSPSKQTSYLAFMKEMKSRFSLVQSSVENILFMNWKLGSKQCDVSPNIVHISLLHDQVTNEKPYSKLNVS